RRTPPSPPRRSRPGRRGIIVAVLALFTLLPLIFLGYYAYAGRYPNFTSGPTSTSSGRTQEAVTRNLPTQQPTPTPNLTANAQATTATTAQAKASATAGVIQTATAGQPIYQDALNDPNNSTTQAAQWDGIDGS